MIVQHNLMGMNSVRQMGLNTAGLQTSLEQLSSGYRINRAADDAAGLAISERMRAQMTGLNRAVMNAQDGASLIQTAEGALGEVHGMLNRLTELATQAANGTIQASDRQKLQAEADALLGEMDRISRATNFNGINLLDGSLSAGGTGSVQLGGLKAGETAAVAGKYAFAQMRAQTTLEAGDTLSYTVATNKGDSYTVEFTVGDDLQTLTTEGGGTYRLANAASGGTVDVGADELASALATELRQTKLDTQFVIAQDGQGLTFQSRQPGTGAARVTSLSESREGVWQGNVGMTVPIKPADEARDIAADAFTLFDGTNEGTATFSVNGQDFVLVNDATYAADVDKLKSRDVIAIRVSGAALEQADLQRIAADVNHATGAAFEAGSDSISAKMPGGGAGLTMQVGDTAAAYNQVSVTVGDMSSLGLGLTSISLGSQESASRALSRINQAIETVSASRGDLGAMQNRLGYTKNNLEVTSENMTAAESRIRDTDMAKMMMRFTKYNVLTQASQAMLAQANTQAQQVLQLLTS